MRRRSVAIATVLAAAFVLIWAATGRGPSSTARDAVTPCAGASPMPAAPPSLTVCATPVPVVDLGTPAATAGLTITLGLSSDEAGPLTLTVGVSDAGGAPVAGATVVVKARHLDMDMGEFPHTALPTAPGRYVAEKVGMGMGGHWRVEVDVSRPGQPVVVVYFRVTLKGLA
jgi:hypothetical protein